MKRGHLAVIVQNLDVNYSSLYFAAAYYFRYFVEYRINFTVPLEGQLIWEYKAAKKTWEKGHEQLQVCPHKSGTDAGSFSKWNEYDLEIKGSNNLEAKRKIMK